MCLPFSEELKIRVLPLHHLLIGGELRCRSPRCYPPIVFKTSLQAAAVNSPICLSEVFFLKFRNFMEQNKENLFAVRLPLAEGSGIEPQAVTLTQLSRLVPTQ